MTALIDSGPMIALFNARDMYHQQALAFMKSCRFQLMTTLASVTEVVYTLGRSQSAQQDYLEWILRGAVRIADIELEDLYQIRELMRKYADRPMDFTDATLIAVAQRDDIMHIASFDSDFDIYRTKAKKKLVNVFRETK
jgi:uncharacterized protein